MGVSSLRVWACAAYNGEPTFEIPAFRCPKESLEQLQDYEACRHSDHPLIEAAKRGSLELVKHFLTLQPEELRLNMLNDKDAEGLTALHWAAVNGHLGTLQFLLDFAHQIGANIIDAAQDNAGNTIGAFAFIMAASNGHLEILQFLLDRGVNINIPDNSGITSGGLAFAKAAENGHLRILQFLLTVGVNININMPDDFTSGGLAFIMAAGQGHLRILQFLLASGVNINIPNNAGITVGAAAFLWAAIAGHLNILEYLLSVSQIDINARVWREPNLLCGVISQGFLHPTMPEPTAVVNFLIRHGIDINAVDDEGRTALYLAIDKGYNNCVRIILAVPGVKINIRDGGGGYPLSLREGRNPEAVSLITDLLTSYEERREIADLKRSQKTKLKNSFSQYFLIL
ncbi:MAG: ankyrin repeat domain-containing protein [Chlamydiae bacterium]|nr:ankyrin repeat domain-containing protein [Chlamydiota bacterium]